MNHVSRFHALTGRRRDGRHLQCPQSEDAAQYDFLAHIDLQFPDHWEGETQDHEVNQEVCNSVPLVESWLVDA